MIQTQTDNRNNVNPKYWQQRAENPIIRGYFPKYKTYKEMAIAKVNRFLCIVLGISIFISFVSYYFVTANEVILDSVGREITETKAQNLDLQNKLDNLKSYYNVDKTVRQKNLLQKPEEVVEVNSVNNIDNATTATKVKNSSSEIKVNWAVGY